MNAKISAPSLGWRPGRLCRALAGLALLVLSLSRTASAQEGRGETVTWTVSARPQITAPAGSLTLILHGRVLEGWHVYSLKQLPGGPTPLRVSLDSNPIATASGELAGSPPIIIHDPDFDLDTQFYSHAFTITLPLRIGVRPASGRTLIPVSVRFQTCNDRVCQPPKTVHLFASVTVAAGR
ncbi:MAG: protein-disulfide reductase DsbD N-terminal domain-containing protein [Rhizomicrobium sp.]